MTTQSSAHKKPTHIGEIVRKLREGARLTRLELGEQTNISASTIMNLETGRHRAHTWTLLKLVQHPSMVTLPEKAKEAGISSGIEDNRVDSK
jgi:transcriptional regulator with XRE-family HTH domain